MPSPRSDTGTDREFRADDPTSPPGSVPTAQDTAVAVVGLGAMGRALADSLLDHGHAVTVWNRSPGRSAPLVDRGATPATTIRVATTATEVVVVCLFDHASVVDVLQPDADALSGRTVINLTTTTPNEARGLARWAEQHGIGYLDGAIMATPPMIGSREAAILYSGSRTVFDRHRPMLDAWGTSTFEGDDAGMASLFDLAILSAMYPLFAGFFHGAAMVGSAGVSAHEFARRAAPFLAAMTETFTSSAEVIDSGNYSEPVQSLTWTATALDTIARASSDQGTNPAPIAMVQALVRDQIDRGHGAEDSDRIYESLRSVE